MHLVFDQINIFGLFHVNKRRQGRLHVILHSSWLKTSTKLSPGHSLPPNLGSGLVHVLERDTVNSTQVVDQGPHVSHPPSSVDSKLKLLEQTERYSVHFR